MSSKRRSNKKLMMEQRRVEKNKKRRKESSMEQLNQEKEADKPELKQDNVAVEQITAVANEQIGGIYMDNSMETKAEEVANTTKDVKAEDVTAAHSDISGVEHKLYIQYNDLEFSDELIFEAAVNAYCEEFGKDKSSVKKVNLYVKPQEGKAYYVINDNAEESGSIDL